MNARRVESPVEGVAGLGKGARRVVEAVGIGICDDVANVRTGG